MFFSTLQTKHSSLHKLLSIYVYATSNRDIHQVSNSCQIVGSCIGINIYFSLKFENNF